MFKPTSRFALFLLSIAAAAVALPASAQSVTGVWSGTYTYSVQISNCSNKTFTGGGNVSLTLLQTGASVSGRIDLANDVAIDANCNASTVEVTRSIVGSAGAGSMTFTAPASPASPQFQAIVSGNSITANWTDSNGGEGTLTVTRTTGDAPAVNLTGSWTGTYSFSDTCPNGKTLKYTGPFTMGLTQSGSTAGGVVTMQNVPLYDQNCSTLATLTQSMAVTGTVSGSTFSGAVYDPAGSFDFPITTTISNGSLNGSVSGASITNTAGTFTLTQSATTAPAADLGGSYEGSYTEQDNETFTCLNIATLTFSGDASLTVIQAGSNVTGWLTFHNAEDVVTDGFGGCAIVGIGDEVLPFWGTLSGNTLQATVPVGTTAVALSVTLGGDAANGTLQDSVGDVAAFNLTRTASATAVSIDSFAAVPTTAVAGTPVTLSWKTTNATSVSIDNGAGSQPLSGSISVFPLQTTTYTLTASGPGGPVTAKTTVAVVPLGPKRRAAKP